MILRVATLTDRAATEQLVQPSLALRRVLLLLIMLMLIGRHALTSCHVFRALLPNLCVRRFASIPDEFYFVAVYANLSPTEYILLET